MAHSRHLLLLGVVSLHEFVFERYRVRIVVGVISETNHGVLVLVTSGIQPGQSLSLITTPRHNIIIDCCTIANELAPSSDRYCKRFQAMKRLTIFVSAGAERLWTVKFRHIKVRRIDHWCDAGSDLQLPRRVNSGGYDIERAYAYIGALIPRHNAVDVLGDRPVELLKIIIAIFRLL